MDSSQLELVQSLPFQSTLFFPLSANPAGYNHLAAAEGLLRADASLERVVFIPSNGHHPDPTKADAQVDGQERLALLRTTLQAFGDPEQCFFARRAKAQGEPLRLTPERMVVWCSEFAHARAVPTQETMALLRGARPEDQHPLRWFAGSDLLARMADPRIFSQEHLAYFAENCRYALLERTGFDTGDAVQALIQKRSIRLAHDLFRAADFSPWLAPFLQLSSTHIRHAAEAGDPLAAMIPQPTVERILQGGTYHMGQPVARLVTENGDPIASRTALQLRLEGLESELEAQGSALATRLAASHGAANRAAGRPYSFSVVEATVGGWLTRALAGRSGASRYFRQSRFAYDQRAKESLLGGEAPPKGSAVSKEMAIALARGMAREAGTDFALAETGMAGPPDGNRRSMKNGLCKIALVTPKGVHHAEVQFHPFETRREHQLQFAVRALALTLEWLTEDGY